VLGTDPRWVNGCAAATYLYLLLSYLDRYRLAKITPEVMQQLAQSQPSFGKLRLKAAHAIIDHYYGRTGFWLGPEPKKSRHRMAIVDATEPIFTKAHTAQGHASKP
jgi:hypothetical protein